MDMDLWKRGISIIDLNGKVRWVRLGWHGKIISKVTAKERKAVIKDLRAETIKDLKVKYGVSRLRILPRRDSCYSLTGNDLTPDDW